MLSVGCLLHVVRCVLCVVCFLVAGSSLVRWLWFVGCRVLFVVDVVCCLLVVACGLCSLFDACC